MKLKLILTTAIVGVALALPSVSNAAPPPDAGFGVPSDGPAVFGFSDFSVLTISPRRAARAGRTRPEQVDSRVPRDQLIDRGPITCLAVNGNTASHQRQSSPALRHRDRAGGGRQPDTFELFATGRAATDCSPPPPAAHHRSEHRRHQGGRCTGPDHKGPMQG